MIEVAVSIPWWLPATVVSVIGLLIPMRPGSFDSIGSLFEYVVIFPVLAIVWTITAFLK